MGSPRGTTALTFNQLANICLHIEEVCAIVLVEPVSRVGDAWARFGYVATAFDVLTAAIVSIDMLVCHDAPLAQ